MRVCVSLQRVRMTRENIDSNTDNSAKIFSECYVCTCKYFHQVAHKREIPIQLLRVKKKKKWKVIVAQQCPMLCNCMDCSSPSSSVHGDSPGKNTGVGCHAFLRGIFPTHGSNPGLPHCRRILYPLSHQGSPSILQWVACPFFGDLPNPEIKPGSPALQADSLPTELLGKPCS